VGTVLLLGLSAVVGFAGSAGAAGRTETPPAVGEFPDDAVPAGFDSWSEVLSTQQALNAVATRVRGATAAVSGFAGVSDAVDERRVVLYWQGSPPDDVLAVVERERGTVVIVSAAYSERTLRAAVDRVFAAAAGEPAVRVGSVVPLADGSGIRVAVTGDLEAARATVDRVAGVDATVEVGDAMPVGLPNRVKDASPWRAGARWKNSSDYHCTMGFAVHRTDNGEPYMFSAAHCADLLNNTFDDDEGWDTNPYYTGNVMVDDDPHDIMLVHRSHGPPGDQMYVGPYDSSSSVRVAGTAMASFPGEYVCASGGFSGSTCYSKVVSVGGYLDYGSIVVGPVVMAEQVSHTAAVGVGDSGGPVYFAGPPDGHVAPTAMVRTAMGSVSAIDLSTAAPCPGVQAEGRSCTWRWFYVDITGPLSQYGLAMN